MVMDCMSLLNKAVPKIDKINVPKYVTITNKRLGILLRVLQILAATYLVIECWIMQPWMQSHPPLEYGFAAWREGPYDSVSARDSSVAHCSNAGSFAFDWSATWRYAPGGCRVLPSAEQYVRNQAGLFFPTYMQDTWNWEGRSASACSASNRHGALNESDCVARGGTWTARGGTWTGDSDHCGCSIVSDYFAKNPEEQMVFVLHGFDAVTTDGFGETRMTKRSSLVDDNILTIVRNQDKKECSIGSHLQAGAHSRWEPDEAKLGVGASLKEWIACSGMDLDTRQKELAGKVPGQMPALRLTGLVLQLDMMYMNPHDEDWPETVCYLTVEVIPQWTAQNSIGYDTSLDPGADEASFRERYAYGVAVTMKARGSVRGFNTFAMLTIIVNAIVILSFPVQIIYWIALYCAGLPSKIYRNAACEQLDIFKDLPGIVSRQMIAAQGFKQICNAENSLTHNDVVHLVRTIMNKHMAENRIDEDELQAFVACWMEKLDADASGYVQIDEFLEACGCKETMDLTSVAHFFDVERKRGIMERIFMSIPPEVNRHQHRAMTKEFSSVHSASTSSVVIVPLASQTTASEPAEEAAAGNDGEPPAAIVSDEGDVTRQDQATI